MTQPINVTYRFRSGANSDLPAVAANDLVPLHQLEEMIAGSLKSLESVKVAFHENQVVATGGFLTEDGYTLVAEDRFLLSAQTDAAENGIYVVDADGNWTRTADADEASELKAHTSVFILEGDHAGRKYELLADVATVGVDAQLWNTVPIPAATALNTSLDSSQLYFSNAANLQSVMTDIGNTMMQNQIDAAASYQRTTQLFGTNANNLGVFNGTLFPDGSNVLQVLQVAESTLESLAAEQASSKFISPADITIPNQLWTTVAHNLSSSFPSSVQMFDAEDNYTHATHAFRWRPKRDGEGLIIPDAIEIFQDSGVDRHVKVVVQR
ncbi:hypothetical protein pVco7_gp083 [Vibrio phage pVco-7]